MEEDIQIIDIKFSPPRWDEPDFERGERRAWSDIAINVRNRSTKTTHYVRADLHAIRYDAGSGRLGLMLAELEPSKEILAARFIQPRFLPILPGTTAVIHESVPVRMNVIDFAADGPGKVRVIDISMMKSVDVTVSHAPTPFRAVHTDSVYEIHKQLCDWGKRISHIVERCLPEHNKSKSETQGIK